MKDAIGFGALNVDLIYEVPTFDLLEVRDGSLKPGGEVFGTPAEYGTVSSLIAAKGKLVSQSGGGQAANVMVALSRMGFSTGYFGKVGGDDYGQFLLKNMESVDISLVRQSGDTGICFVLLDSNRDRSNLVFTNANDELGVADLDLGKLRQTRFIHLTSFVGEQPLKAQKRLVSELPSPVKISFDPGELYARRNLRELLPIIQRSTVVFLTDKEVMLLTGKSWEEGTKDLLRWGPNIIVCKRGGEGAYVLTRDIELNIPPDKVKVIDTTGAGDVFAAGFLAGMLLGRPLYECARFASKAAAQSIAGYGREKYPDQEFLNRFFGLQSSIKTESG